MEAVFKTSKYVRYKNDPKKSIFFAKLGSKHSMLS